MSGLSEPSLDSTDGSVTDLDTLAALERAARETGWTANELTDALAILTPIIATELAAAREALGRVRELAERRPFFIVDCGAGLFYDSVLVDDLTDALDGPSGGGGV